MLYNMTVLHDEQDTLQNLGKFAAKIAYYNYEWRFITLVIFNTMKVASCLDTFLANYNKTTILKMGEFVPRHRVQVPQYVIIGYETTELTNVLRWLIKSQYDNTGKYVIICSSLNPSQCEEQEIFQTLSTLYIYNIVFIKGSQIDSEPLAFTYYPILPGKCKNANPERVHIDSSCANSSCKSLFPEKLKNLHRCRFVISTIEQPPFMYLYNGTREPAGGDADIIKLVANILNATLIIKTPVVGTDWGHYENNNWTGSLGDVYNLLAHASMCSIPLTPNKYGNFQISFTYYSMDIVWVTRLPALKPAWEKLFYPLKLYTQIAIFFMFIGIVSMNTFIKTEKWRKVRRALNIARPKSNLFFYSWVIFLGMSVIKLPSNTTLRAIVSCWIWFSYLFRNAYQAALFNAIKLQRYEDYFTDFQEVLKQGYPYGGPYSLRDYYADEPEIFSNWKNVKLAKSYDMIDKLLDGNTKFVLALNKENIINHLMEYNATKRLQILPEKIVNSPTALYFKKYAPLKAPVNSILSVLVEAGFTELLYARYLDRGNYLFGHSDTYDIPEPLGLEHFTSSFMALLVGLILSTIYFAVEVFFGPHST